MGLGKLNHHPELNYQKITHFPSQLVYKKDRNS